MSSRDQPKRPLRLVLADDENTRLLGVEARRALALFRAVNLAGDLPAARALLRFSGRPDEQEAKVGEADCVALAERLREAGYPLTDRGIKVFKMERGFSHAVRIGPEIAQAYARFANGDKQPEAPAAPKAAQGVERERAARILALVGQNTRELALVRHALGHDEAEPTAKRLVGWLHGFNMRLDDEGLVDIARALGKASLTVDDALARVVIDAVLGRGEPVHDYTRLTCEGATLNGRTLAMLTAAEALLDGEVRVRVVKGSYEQGVHRGAHPHMGGGVADLSVRGYTPEQIARFVQALRKIGFAAWYRPRESRQHIHAVAIGDRDMGASAEWQVKQYFLGRDGRTRMGKDEHGGVPQDIAPWTLKYRMASL